jgi:hypothetical protein
MENKKCMGHPPFPPELHQKGMCRNHEEHLEKMEQFKEAKYFIICDEKMTPMKIKRIVRENGELKKEFLHLKN